MRKIIFIFVFFSISYLFAQPQIMSTAGTDFVLCFPLNTYYENNKNTSLILFATSLNGDTVMGTIENFYTEPYQINFTVTGDSVKQIRIPNNLEVNSYSNSEKKGIFVRTDRPINLYGLSAKLNSSDAFLCYPTETLDTLYTTASYNNFFQSVDIPGINVRNFFSNITIVGTEDSTLVNIIPSCPVYSPKVTKYENFSFIINRGETRQLIPEVTDELDTSAINDYDLTASIITSSKKIALFSGHSYAAITSDNEGSIDMLLDETPPISLLGIESIITPINSWDSKFKSYIRIIPFFDSTRFLIGDSIYSLDRFSFWECYINSPLVVKTNKPVLTAIYGWISKDVSGKFNGDPFLIHIPPIEQFLDEYRFISLPHPNYREHFINIVITKKGIESLVLDGLSLPDSIFQEVSGTSYLWGRTTVSPGSHHIKSDSCFGLIVYGNGFYDSYGYSAGQKTERLLESIVDNHKPEILKTNDCQPYISIREENSFDSGIESIEILISENIEANIPSFSSGAFTVSINPKLINQFEDGELIYLVKDKKGLMTYDTLNLKGLTLELSSNSSEEQVQVGSINVDTVYLRNYGKYSQILNAYCKENIYISIPQYGFPLILAPGFTKEIDVVYGSYNLGKTIDTAVFVDECGRIREKEIIFESKPNIYTGDADCGVKIIAKSKKSLNISYFDNSILIENLNGSVEIYNILGALVLKEEMIGTREIQMQDYPSGLYFIRVSGKTIKFFKRN